MFEFILSFSPIVVLLINLLLFKMSAPKASALAFLVTLLEFVTIFKPGMIGIEITLKKDWQWVSSWDLSHLVQ